MEDGVTGTHVMLIKVVARIICGIALVVISTVPAVFAYVGRAFLKETTDVSASCAAL